MEHALVGGRAIMEQDSEPQQRSLAKFTAASMKRAGSAPVPGSATSCSTPHQFSVCVLACASRSTPRPECAWRVCTKRF